VFWVWKGTERSKARGRTRKGEKIGDGSLDAELVAGRGETCMKESGRKTRRGKEKKKKKEKIGPNKHTKERERFARGDTGKRGRE